MVIKSANFICNLYPRKYKIYLPFFAFANRMVECLGAYLAQGFEGKDGQIKNSLKNKKNE